MAGYSQSDLTTFNAKWKDLFAQAQAHGISSPAIHQVYNLDLNRLEGGSAYALSKEEAFAAMQSAASGAPVTPAPAPPFSVSRLPGYLGTDVKDFGVGLLGLMKKAIGDVAHPTHLEGQVSALWRDPRVVKDPANALENLFLHGGGAHGHEDFLYSLGQSPLLSAVVPGAAVGSELVTRSGNYNPAGLAQVGEHPFTSALDVLPGAGALGRLGKAGARLGLTAAERATLDEATRYRPSDLSAEAQAARQAAQGVLPGALRRAAAQTGPSGLVSMMHRLVLETPLHNETIAAWGARRIGSATAGQVGPTAAMVGRMLQSTRRDYASGMAGLTKDLDGWYSSHGLATTKERTDFAWLLTHYRDDWRAAYRERFTPQEADKLDNALGHYDTLVHEQTTKDLASDRLAIVTDPRTGRDEVRGTEGTDRRVVSAQKLYVARRDAALGAARALATATGVDIPTDAAGAWVALQRHLATELLAPAQRFMALDPRAAESIPQGGLRGLFPPGEGARQASATAVRRVGRLFGPNGSFAMLARALAGGDLATSRALVASVLTTLKSATAMRNTELAALIPAYERARATIDLGRRPAVPRALQAHDRAREALEKAIDRNPEARFAPRMAELVQDRLLARLNGTEVTPEDFSMLFDQIENGLWKGERFGDLVGAREMTQIRSSALKQLASERAQGFAPRFVYSTRPGEHEHLASSAFAGERISTSRSAKSRVSINPAAVYDPILGLLRKGADDLEEAVMREFFYGPQGFVPRFGVKYDDVVRQALQLIREPRAGTAVTRQHLVEQWVREHYTELRPTDYFPRREASAAGLASAVPVLVPKEVGQALDANLRALRASQNVGLRTYAAGTRIFRRSLLGYSPRYQAHIWAGGSALLALRSDPLEMARHLTTALGMTLTDHGQLLAFVRDEASMRPLRPVVGWLQRKAARSGEGGGLPVRISHELPESDPQDLLNHYGYARGAKLATWWKEIQDSKSATTRGLAKVVSGQAGMDLAAFGANMLRALAYLIGKERAGGDVEAGIRFALKVYADMDGMTPMERTIIRYVMPFYGWTRHIVQYVSTLPFDHPYRAAVISQMVNQEWEDWNSGLPQSLMYLMQIGGTAADGSATVLDIRQLDPLRSVSDVFTMAGFLSTLNPAFQNVALPALGIDPASGGPEQLYPTLTLNQFTGAETGQKASLSSVLEAGTMGYVPESGVLDHFLGWSSYTRWAKTNDPRAYANQLSSALNFPWIPQKLNLLGQIAKTEVDRYNVARDAATAAVTNPDPNSAQWKALFSYSYVPYHGWLVQPRVLRQWVFDEVTKAGYWNGRTATLPPNTVIVPPAAPRM